MGSRRRFRRRSTSSRSNDVARPLTCHVVAVVVGGGCERLVMVVGGGGVGLWSLWLSAFVGCHCRTSPFIVRWHVSPVSCVNKEEGDGGLLLTSTVSVDQRSPFVVDVDSDDDWRRHCLDDVARPLMCQIVFIPSKWRVFLLSLPSVLIVLSVRLVTWRCHVG